MAEKITKRQLKEDKFVETVFTGWSYARDNPAYVALGLIALVALLVLAIKIGGSATGRQRIDETSEAALVAARTEFARGNSDAGLAALQDVTARHGGSRASREASYLLASALFENGDYQGARASFEQFLRKPLHDEILADGARLGLAACLEETGDLSGAATAYRALWNTAGDPALRLQAGLAAARCARAEARTAEALALYREIAAAYPASPEAARAEFEILVLTAGAGHEPDHG